MMQHDNIPGQTSSAEEQLAELMAKFEPGNQRLILSIRKALRNKFPTVNELVYDYDRALVIAYSPNERGSDAIVSMSAEANGVRLVFTQGVSLPDPHKILLGDARQTRYIQLESTKVLLRPEVASLMAAAVSKATIPISPSGRGNLIIKSSKKRPKGGPVKSKRPNTNSGGQMPPHKKTGKG